MRTCLPLAFLAFLLVSCGKEPIAPPVAEQPVTKTITFEVFAAKDYSPGIYSNVLVDVNLGISIIDKKTGTSTTVWDTTFSRRKLNLYPQQADKYVVEKNIPVLESTQLINVGYWLRYDTDGQIQQQGSGEGVNQWIKNFRQYVAL